MRHGKRIARLGKPADQRKALMRSLTTELLRHGQITTTLVRAKAVRSEAEHIITLAKEGSIHSRRQAAGYLFDPSLVKALFDGVPERYGKRVGGYTRIMRTVSRRGDGAPMAVIELID